MNGSTPGCSNASPRRPWLPMTGSSGSTSASVPWTAASTKHRPVARAPARTLVIGPSRAGSGRCSRNATASRSGGRPPARTATTPSCWNPHSLPQLSAACSPSARRCTSTAATTTALCVASSTAAASTTSSAPGVAKPAPRMARSSCPWGCAGPSNAPTPGCRTSGSSDATPTGASSTGSRNSPSRSCSSSPPSSSTGEPDGAHDHAYPLKLLVAQDETVGDRLPRLVEGRERVSDLLGGPAVVGLELVLDRGPADEADLTAPDDEHLPRDTLGGRRTEVRDEGRDVLGREHLEVAVLGVEAAEGLGHPGARPRRDRVDGDAVTTERLRRGDRHLDDPALRGRVVRLADGAPQARFGRGVDDPAVDGRVGLLGRVPPVLGRVAHHAEVTLEVDADDEVEVVLAHVEQHPVA